MDNENTLEYRLGIDFADLAQRAKLASQIEDILSNRNKIDIEKLDKFLKDYHNVFGDDCIRRQMFQDDCYKSYCEAEKLRFNILKLYSFSEHIGENWLALLEETPISDEYMRDLLFKFYREFKRSIYKNFEGFSFLPYNKPYLHKLRISSADLELYMIKNIKMIITFSNKAHLDQHIQNIIYNHTIDWILKPQEIVDIKLVNKQCCIELTTITDYIRKHNIDTNYYELPRCELWYKNQMIDPKEKTIYGLILNHKITFIAQNVVIEKELLAKVRFDDLRVEIDCDMEYWQL